MWWQSSFSPAANNWKLHTNKCDSCLGFLFHPNAPKKGNTVL